MMLTEEPIVFDCAGSRLLGIVHCPDSSRNRGVLIIVGGPQYRVGSHRQFLHLARDLAASGTPVLRYDYRGMGDSDGAAISFEDTRNDIQSAIDQFFDRVPGLREVVIWGLCDAASAALMYATLDSRVCGLVLANPWVRTGESMARTYLQRYYRSRWLDPVLWKRLLTGRINVISSLAEFWRTLLASRSAFGSSGEDSANPTLSYTDRMLQGLERFTGRVLLITSGEDLVAAEFTDLVEASSAWQKALHRPAVEHRVFAEANHTFTRQEWRDRVSGWTDEWIRSW